MYKDKSNTEESSAGNFSRRGFLKSIGGGVVVLFTTAPRFSLGQAHDASHNTLPFNAYLQIGKDGRVTCFTGKIEMGQGIITSLPQMLADELDVAVDSIDMVMGDTDRCPFDRGTWGSLSTRVYGPELRAAGAQARHVLLGLAATQLGVNTGQLKVKDGVVFSTSDKSRQVSYAELAQKHDIVQTAEANVAVKKPADYSVMGTPQTRRDAREKVTGKAQFTADIHLPGMLLARVLRPPSHAAKLKQIDTAKAGAIEGVRIVQEGDLVAVLHPDRDIADRAIGLIKADYDITKTGVDDKNIYAHLMSMAPDGEQVAGNGDLAKGEALATTVIEETYHTAYVAHAPIEPHAALAEYKDGKMTVWASTQSPFGLKGQLVSVLGLDENKVRVITPFVGGGFGGKSASSQGLQAARLAKIAGKPVQVFWTREDEFFWDTYRPASIIKVRSGLTKDGAPAFWDYHVYYAGARSTEMHYDIPHYTTTAHRRSWGAPEGSHPFATGAWRAPGASANVFARESHIDIMAARAGIDPLEYRLKNCSDPKFIGVLKAAAKQFDWKPSAAPSGRGVGVACGIDAGTVVASMAEVEVNPKNGAITVKRVVCAQDMGQVVNPAGAILQMEGCITMGLGYALTEEQRFKDGEIQGLNFYDYDIPLFSWLPKIETILIDSDDPDPHGGGEPAIINMGAVIANAVFDATGKRLFELPMTPARVKAAEAVE